MKIYLFIYSFVTIKARINPNSTVDPDYLTFPFNFFMGGMNFGGLLIYILLIWRL